MQHSFINNPFSELSVAVVGDIVLDAFHYGTADRLSPEAPVPVVNITRKKLSLGGAGNTAANLCALGAGCTLIGRVGQDMPGTQVQTMLEEMGMNTHSLLHNADLPTSYKTRVVAAGQQIVRMDEETIAPLTQAELTALEQKLLAARQSTNTLIVSDYGKGMITPQSMDMIRSIWEKGTIIVDPKPRSGSDYTGVTCMTPNLKEAAELLGVHTTAKTDNEAAEMAAALVQKFKLQSVVLTRAGDGMTYHNGANATHFAADTIEVRDVSGAGDTVIATLAAGFAAGLGAKAVQLANTAGQLVVAKQGTATVSWHELAARLALQTSTRAA